MTGSGISRPVLRVSNESRELKYGKQNDDRLEQLALTRRALSTDRSSSGVTQPRPRGARGKERVAGEQLGDGRRIRRREMERQADGPRRVDRAHDRIDDEVERREVHASASDRPESASRIRWPSSA